jgi:hypothetical protein
MLRPIIMIGCGGSGQKAVRYVRDAVRRRLEHAGWDGDFPKAWQFLGIDTVNIQEDPSIPFLPNNDYVSVSLDFASYQALNNSVETQFGPQTNNVAFRDLVGWRPNPFEVTVPLKEGAGQLRAVGRTAGILALQDVVRQRLKVAFGQCTHGGPELNEVSKHLGITVPPGTPVPDPLTIVIGSMAGGTGAGIMLDVVDLVRRTDDKGGYPILVGFTPDIFGTLQTDAMTANAAAFMSEMMSAYWDNENTDNALLPTDVQVNTRGPHSTFLIGRKNIDGLDLSDSKNVYRAVGEALAAVTTSGQVQGEFNNFIKGNWPVKAPENQGGYGFANQYLPGVASSFGSSTISIGRDRQREYIKRLIHRSIIEHLVDGFESVASVTLGETIAKSMAGQAKISELARRNVAKFILDCGLQEQASGTRQVTEGFVSPDILRAKLNSTTQEIKKSLNSAQQVSASTWQQMIFSKAQELQGLSNQQVDAELSSQLRSWGSGLLQQVLKTTTEHSANLSMPVVIAMLELTRAQVLESAQVLRDEAKQARELSAKSSGEARNHLSGKGNGNLAMNNSTVESTIADASKAIVHEWSALVREKLAITLESVAQSMLSSVDAALRASLSRLNALATPQEGKAPVIAEWPKNDGVVPTSFAPSPVEFYLEDYTTWPSSTDEMLVRSLGDRTGLPLKPVEAARTLIIRGGFNGSERDSIVMPLVWADGYGEQPVWEVGLNVSVKVQDDLEALGNRIDSWLKRPATEISSILNENLGDYLQTNHPKTGVAIPNHQERLARFRQMLQLALMQSRPLVEIDVAMNATVHPKPLSFVLNIQGFPFGVGHPARKSTEEIIQGFLSTAEGVDWAFTSSETESVLLTSFLEYPVHPSVVTSFTRPLNQSLTNMNPDLLKSSFWQWRRARILENFVPLPDEIRIAAIRGFAVARALGLVTAIEDGQNEISNNEGVFKFPKNLLTVYNKNNILPALLESMILTFADAATNGVKAFRAYGALVDFGLSAGGASSFKVDRDLARILKTGDYGSIQVVDQERARKILASDSEQGRRDVVKVYIENNLKRIQKIVKQADPANTYGDPKYDVLYRKAWRTKVGEVVPVDALTLELANDMVKAYSQVLAAIISDIDDDEDDV